MKIKLGNVFKLYFFIHEGTLSSMTVPKKKALPGII